MEDSSPTFDLNHPFHFETLEALMFLKGLSSLAKRQLFSTANNDFNS